MFSKKMVIKIEGMKCEHCANSVKNALEKIDNVKSVKVNLKSNEAVISYNKNIDINIVKEKINELGYNFIN